MQKGAPKSFEELKARAASGDAAAQYALAAHLNGLGQPDAARQWLDRAAAQNHPDALFTRFAAALSIRDAGALAKSVDGLRRAASLGSAPAMRLLCALHAGGVLADDDWPAARRSLLEALDKGDAQAMRDAALFLFINDPDDPDGARLIDEAARVDLPAAAVAVRRALSGRRGASAGTARDVLPGLVKAGFPLPASPANELREKAAPEEPRSAILRDRIAAKLETIRQPAPPKRILLSERPRVWKIEAAFAPEECDFLIAAALPRLSRGEIAGADGEAVIDRYRTAWSASFWPGSSEPPGVLIARRLAALAETPFENAEALTVLRYRPGEEYRPHHDFLTEDEPELAERGQRVRTALISLNDDFDGGETHFLGPDIKWRGRAGDAIVFDNVDEKGAPDISARHAGHPVTRGVKWLASLWMRDRRYFGRA